jgi:hypothetical protein
MNLYYFKWHKYNFLNFLLYLCSYRIQSNTKKIPQTSLTFLLPRNIDSPNKNSNRRARKHRCCTFFKLRCLCTRSPKDFPFPLLSLCFTLTGGDPSLAKCPPTRPPWLTPSPSRFNSLNPSRSSPHLAFPSPSSGELHFFLFFIFIHNYENKMLIAERIIFSYNNTVKILVRLCLFLLKPMI